MIATSKDEFDPDWIRKTMLYRWCSCRCCSVFYDTLDEVGGSGTWAGADAGEEGVMNVEELEFRIFESTTPNSQVDLLTILTAPLGLLLLFVWSVSRSWPQIELAYQAVVRVRAALCNKKAWYKQLCSGNLTNCMALTCNFVWLS